jgi:hypothetical protein
MRRSKTGAHRLGVKMIKLTIAASSTAVSAAVLGMALAAVFASVAPQAKAEPQTSPVVYQPLAKADRLPVRTKGAACSSHAWPYYDQDCRFDLRSPANVARAIRVIALR